MQIRKSILGAILALAGILAIAYGSIAFLPGIYASHILKAYEVELSSKEFVDSACRQDIGTVALMLEAGINVNAQSPDEHRTNVNTTALHCASNKSDLRLVDILLAHGASVNVQNQVKETPLMAAVMAPPRNGAPTSIDVINDLLSKGANINAVSESGTALHIACRSGNMKLVNFLLDHGADPALLDSKGASPLNICSSNMYSGQEIPFDRLMAKGVNIDAVDQGGESALFRAVQNSNEKLVERLLSLGANPNFIGSSGNAILPAAVRRIEMTQLLVNKGANVNLAGKNGTALSAAISSRDMTTIGFLLSKGADINAADQQGNTALHQAATNMNAEATIKMLITNGASPNVKNLEGNTPLHLATRSRNIEAVNALLANGARVNERNFAGQTPLQLAKANSPNFSMPMAVMIGNGQRPVPFQNNQSDIEKLLTRHGGRS
jgi:serine/threonine-protein phosphatase 6 regulatory ankyrin repeat subunit A